MSTRSLIKRDSGGRPTQGGLRLPGRDASDQPGQPAKSIALKVGRHHTSDGRITKSSNSVRNRKRHGTPSASKHPASKGRALQVSGSMKPEEGSLHEESAREKSLAREAILEAHKKSISEPYVGPIATEFLGFDPNNLSENWKSKGYHQNKAYDNVQSDADAATPAIQPTHSPESVRNGITIDPCHGTDASVQGIREENIVAPYSNFGLGESQGSYNGESAPPNADQNPFTGPAASFGL